MLRFSLVARGRAPSLSVHTASICHLLPIANGPPPASLASVVVGCRGFARLNESSTADASAFTKFYESVKKLDAAVKKRDLKWTERMFREVDEIRADATEEDKQKAARRCVETYKKLQTNSSVRLTMGKSVADFYQYKMNEPGVAVDYYLEVLGELSSLPKGRETMGDCLQVDMLSNVAKCYKKLGRCEDAEEYFQKAIEAHEQHRQRRGLAPTSDVDTDFHKKRDYEVLDLQLVFMENLLAAKRWDEVRILLERVVEQVEDSPHLTSPDKLAEIQVVINKSVEWLSEADKPKPRVAFGIALRPQCKEELEQLVTQRRKVNKLWGLNPDEGIKELEKEKVLLNGFAEKSQQDETPEGTMQRTTRAYKQLKKEVPKGCGACTMALTIASAHYSMGQFSSALSYYLEALEIFASNPPDQFRRNWHMAWVERKVMHIGALCAIANCYQNMNDHTKANVFFIQANNVYDLVRDRVLAPDSERDPNTFVLSDHRALCPSTEDEEELLSCLALTVASTLVDYAENLVAQGDWRTAKATTDRAMELAEGCTITQNHIKNRVNNLLKDVAGKNTNQLRG